MASEVSSSAYVSPPSIEELDTEQHITFKTPKQQQSDKSLSPFGTAKTHQSIQGPCSAFETSALHTPQETSGEDVEVHGPNIPLVVLPPQETPVPPLDGPFDTYESLHIPHGLPLETIVEQASYSTLRTGRSSGATAASARVLRHTCSAPSVGQTDPEIKHGSAASRNIDRRKLSQNPEEQALHHQGMVCKLNLISETNETSPRRTHLEPTEPPSPLVKTKDITALESNDSSYKRKTSDALREIFRKFKGDDQAGEIQETSVLADRSNRKTPQSPPRQFRTHSNRRFDMHDAETAPKSQNEYHAESARRLGTNPSKKHPSTKSAHEQDPSPPEPRHGDTQTPNKTQPDLETFIQRGQSPSEHAPSRVNSFLSCHNDSDLSTTREGPRWIPQEELDHSPRYSVFPSRWSPSKQSASKPRSLMPAPLTITKKPRPDSQQNVYRTPDSRTRARTPSGGADTLSDQDPFVSPSLRSSRDDLGPARFTSSGVPIYSNTCPSMRGYDAAEDEVVEKGIAASDSSDSMVAGTSMYQNTPTTGHRSRRDDPFTQSAVSMSPSEPSSPIQVPSPLRVRPHLPASLSAFPHPHSAAFQQDQPRMRTLSSLLHIPSSLPPQKIAGAHEPNLHDGSAADPAIRFRYCAHGRLVVPPGVFTGTKEGNRVPSRFSSKRAQGCWRCEMQDARDTWLTRYGQQRMVPTTPTRSKKDRLTPNNPEHQSTVPPPPRSRFSINKSSTRSQSNNFCTPSKPMTRARDSESSITPPPREWLAVPDSSGRRAVRTSSGWLFVPLDPEAYENDDPQRNCEHRNGVYGLHKSASRRSIRRGGTPPKGAQGVCWKCRVGRTVEGFRDWLVGVVLRCGCGKRTNNKAKRGGKENGDVGKDGSDDGDHSVAPVFVSDEEDFDADDEGDVHDEGVELREMDVRPRGRADSDGTVGHTPPARELLAKNQASFDSLRMKQGVGVRPMSRIADEQAREAETRQPGRSGGRSGSGSGRDIEKRDDEDGRVSRMDGRRPNLPAGGIVQHDNVIDDRVGKARLHQPDSSSSSSTPPAASSVSSTSRAEVESEYASGTALTRVPHRTPTLRGEPSGEAEADAGPENEPSLAQRELARQYREMKGGGSESGADAGRGSGSLRSSLKWRRRRKGAKKDGQRDGDEEGRKAPGLKRARERSVID
ncbi:MAG: hypothetical protein M1831_006603 [Alyxoria varia]|nr:MAG: hypothetical protein M1831_006603 [Alyxoria varia]